MELKPRIDPLHGLHRTIRRQLERQRARHRADGVIPSPAIVLIDRETARSHAYLEAHYLPHSEAIARLGRS